MPFDTVTAGELALVLGGAFLGGILTGALGFAFSIAALTVWAHVLEPIDIVVLGSACATCLHLMSTWSFRREIEFERLGPLLAGGFLGVPVGLFVLRSIPADTFRAAIGICLLTYSTVSVLFPHPLQWLPISRRSEVIAHGVIGWTSGFLGGIAMLHGVLPVIWCRLRGFDRRRARRLYQPFLLIIGIYIFALAQRYLHTNAERFLVYFLGSVPSLVIGMAIGGRVFAWVDEAWFTRLVMAVVFASGALLLV